MERLVRPLAAALFVIGGLVHLQLWLGGYRGIPYVGPLFLLNVAASAALAVGLVVRPGRPVALAGVGLAVGSLVALVLSRTVGLLGFTETAWTSQSLHAVAAEVGGLVAIALLAVTRQRAVWARPLPVTVRRTPVPARRRRTSSSSGTPGSRGGSGPPYHS